MEKKLNNKESLESPVKHITLLEYLEKHITLLEKEREELDRKISILRKAKWDLRSPEKSFKCEKKLNNVDAICIGCERAKPLVRGYHDGKEGTFFRYPGDRVEESFERVKNINSTCEEWRKKYQWPPVCGCGGNLTCMCGYKMGFCFQPTDTSCPFCGRQCRIETYEQGALP